MTQIDELISKIVNFRDARDWAKFHNPKDIAISLSLEASELLEHFQWMPTELTRDLSYEKRAAIAEEIADVFYWVLLISHELKIDPTEALTKKIALNEKKYPVDLSWGNSKKYTDLK